MRKAFTLMEVLVLVAVAPLMLLVVSRIFSTFIQDLPRETRVVQQNTTVLDLLQQVRRDVDGAVDLPKRFDTTEADEHTLLIEQPQVVICYRFEEGRAVRTLLKGQGGFDPNDRHLWRMPNAVISWRPWMRDGGVYAAEIHSHVQQWFADLLRKRLVNTQVFFIHGAGRGREVR
ncbi:MAG: type II secretion system protein [Sedimentisphaerales bacterium]|nr:type II secretion system protein [Sedimentisphaerales bacterium]